MGVVGDNWFDGVSLSNSLQVQTLMLTDAQTPFLGTPLAPLRLMGTYLNGYLVLQGNIPFRTARSRQFQKLLARKRLGTRWAKDPRAGSLGERGSAPKRGGPSTDVFPPTAWWFDNPHRKVAPRSRIPRSTSHFSCSHGTGANRGFTRADLTANNTTCSMFGRALHRQPRVGRPQPQEKVLRPAGVRHL